MSKGSTALENISREDIRLVYTFTKKLGEGAFGSVRIAHKTINPRRKFAVKSMLRDSLIGEESELKQELSILFSADHHNIVRLFEVYLDHKYIHMVTELVDGGDITPSKLPGQLLSESEAADIIRQSLHALTYIHSLNIMHRDLKPENILITKRDRVVKLIDFGQGKFCNKTQSPQADAKGTPLYMAPEVIRGSYDQRCDLWSLGVIAFELLSGELPFQAKKIEELQLKITSRDFDFDGEAWSQVSEEAIMFVERLLETNVERRMTTEEALAHPWM